MQFTNTTIDYFAGFATPHAEHADEGSPIPVAEAAITCAHCRRPSLGHPRHPRSVASTPGGLPRFVTATAVRPADRPPRFRPRHVIALTPLRDIGERSQSDRWRPQPRDVVPCFPEEKWTNSDHRPPTVLIPWTHGRIPWTHGRFRRCNKVRAGSYGNTCHDRSERCTTPGAGRVRGARRRRVHRRRRET